MCYNQARIHGGGNGGNFPPPRLKKSRREKKKNEKLKKIKSAQTEKLTFILENIGFYRTGISMENVSVFLWAVKLKV